MSANPCSVCGGTDLNLIDGYYYCVECGTQDVNAQETVVEHTVLADGTFAHAATRKITKVLNNAIEMSGEWHKWHAFNFILVGLVEELMNLGASIDFRYRALWIWTKYLKEFVDKDQIGTIIEIQQRKENANHKSFFEYEDDIEEENIRKTRKENTEGKINKKKQEQDRNNIKVITKGLLISIIYLALNFEKSDIQLSHLFRFIKEGRLSIANSKKFVPKELDLKSIPYWKNFMNCNKEYVPRNIREIALSLIKVLDLGKPIMPDLRKMVDNYVTELCLPNEFKNLVFSLLHQVPCDYLDVKYTYVKNNLVRMLDYEGVIMSYVLIAFKMTFGLDDDYEIRLSNAVDKINEEDNRLKAYKLGGYSEPTDRLFSFREWSNYLQFRKVMLCKYYLPMAQQCNIDVDDHVFVEHLGERPKRKLILSDEVTMDILNKILPTDEGSVIPKSEFVATLTPMTNYTEVILRYIQEPDVKLLISEDFTQYSLKYACEDLILQNGEENLITGVTEKNKSINKNIVGNLVSNKSDVSMVYVRNCDNQNWLKTKPPTASHMTKIGEVIDDDSYHEYDSGLESPFTEMNITKPVGEDEEDSIPREIETIEEEKEGISIFDDTFNDIDVTEETPENLETETYEFQFNNENLNNSEFENNQGTSINDESFMRESKFNPETFDRARTIKELILAACKKYKIPIPKEYEPRLPRKRKRAHVLEETGALVVKKSKVNRTNRSDERNELDKIFTAYYSSVEKDLFEKVSEHMKSVVQNFIGNETAHVEDNRLEDNPMYNLDGSFVNEDKTIESVDNVDKTLDPRVMEIEEESETNVNDLIPKVDPKFDEKTHDIKQLYVKYSQSLCFENVLGDLDSNIDKILEKKIEEFKNEPITLSNPVNNENVNNSDDDSDDEPFRIENEEKKFLEAKLMQQKEKLEPLIQNSEEITEFNYWFRYYSSECMRKNRDMKERFNLELRENFPRSFSFVIQECAALLNCTAFSLYRHMRNLESVLFNFNANVTLKDAF